MLGWTPQPSWRAQRVTRGHRGVRGVLRGLGGHSQKRLRAAGPAPSWAGNPGKKGGQETPTPLDAPRLPETLPGSPQMIPDPLWNTPNPPWIPPIPSLDPPHLAEQLPQGEGDEGVLEQGPGPAQVIGAMARHVGQAPAGV